MLKLELPPGCPGCGPMKLLGGKPDRDVGTKNRGTTILATPIKPAAVAIGAASAKATRSSSKASKISSAVDVADSKIQSHYQKSK